MRAPLRREGPSSLPKSPHSVGQGHMGLGGTPSAGQPTPVQLRPHLSAKQLGKIKPWAALPQKGTRMGPQKTWHGCREGERELGDLVPSPLPPGGVSHSGTRFGKVFITCQQQAGIRLCALSPASLRGSKPPTQERRGRARGGQILPVIKYLSYWSLTQECLACQLPRPCFSF